VSARILRAFFIRKILDTRLSLNPLQDALRERERLEGATDAELEAELTALALWSGDEDHMPMAPMPGLPSS
jgi:hypothetical protein